MLLVPVHNRIRWNSLPLVTILLMVVNTLVFLFFQLDDEQQFFDAVTYYQESGLAKIELPAARNYADRSGDSALFLELNDVDEMEPPFWVMALQTNVAFMSALHADEVIRISEVGYDKWREKRDKFDALYESVTYIHYGLRTAQTSTITLLTHMFLHADFWHLLGNMVFLFAVGMLVEPALDRAVFLLSYLLAGLGSAGFDIALRSSELIPGIGASGAIAGLMGIYAVLYGLKRIRFFYFIGVYFDYATLPAIVLLPLWMGNELVQMIINSESGVNYLAHLGGLCSGALIAFVVRRALPSFNTAHIEENERLDRFELELQQARELMDDFKPGEALLLLRRLRSERPEHREVLTRSYSCSRISPASDEYHALAQAIFSLQESDAATDQLVRETFNEYLRMAKPVTRMNANMICRLARRFIRQKALAESERLVRIILSKKLPCQESRRLLEGFIALLEEEGRSHDAVLYANQLPAMQQA